MKLIDVVGREMLDKLNGLIVFARLIGYEVEVTNLDSCEIYRFNREDSSDGYKLDFDWLSGELLINLCLTEYNMYVLGFFYGQDIEGALDKMGVFITNEIE